MRTAPRERSGVILLAYYYRPFNTSGVQRAVRLARYLPEYGRPTWVVCSSEKGDLPELDHAVYVPNANTRGTAAQRQEKLGAIVERFTPYREQLPWVPHAVAAAGELINSGEAGCIISTSPPLSTHLAALWISKRYSVRWIADFRDPLYGNPGRARRWSRPYDRALERLILGSANAVVAVTDTVRDEWKQRYPRWRDKYYLIWNGFDPEEQLAPQPIQEREYRVLTHVGVLYALRHPKSLVASLERLVRRARLDPAKVRLRFLGPAQEVDAFTARPDVSFLMEQGCLELRNETVPRQDAQREIASTDYLLLIDIVNLWNVGYTVPAKIFEYILIGRPILAITDRGSPAERILKNSGVPAVFIYHDDTPEQIDAKLMGLYQMPNASVTPSPWFMKNFDGRLQAGAFSTILDSLNR